ncbi:helix-turn-helix domain-containing protein [Streptomyces justiciae]|uniref:Helix-turn-helix domain-containing protein n=1 Tax=Streptomyces justiciae TaxID=2780140 RepID=A0ABU3LMK6_9ACTN|nr:helix-turn-helix domain-containing protein [Streptomyces justiciae]MDT7839868.1 helix-turn-helix domain-containing protein [Streptomyces justiciae]
MRAPACEQRSFSRAYGDIELVTRTDPASWRGSLRLLHLGVLQVASEETDAVEVVRTTRDTTADGRTHLFVRLQLEGAALVFQDGRRARLHPGNLVFYDAGRPFSVVLPEAQRARVLMVPRPLLRLGEAELRRITAKVVDDTTDSPAALLMPLLDGLVREIDAVAPPAREGLARAVADLLAALAADRSTGTEAAGTGPSAATGQAAMLDRVKATIDARLAEPELSPGVLAAEHGISLRYLHKLFQEQGTTVGGWIRRRRLEACRAELARPSAADRTIAAVAARWGFASPTHFSHAFRKAYGVSPAQFRGQRPSG